MTYSKSKYPINALQLDLKKSVLDLPIRVKIKKIN